MTNPIWRRCRGDAPDSDNPYVIVEGLFKSEHGGLLGIVLKHHRHEIYFVVPSSGEKKLARLGPIYTLRHAKSYLTSLLL